jgi:hypothetical protein
MVIGITSPLLLPGRPMPVSIFALVHHEVKPMCPACIASTAAIIAGAGSCGGILALCISKFRKVFRTNPATLLQKT